MLKDSETYCYLRYLSTATFYIDVKFTVMQAVSVLQILCLSLVSIFILSGVLTSQLTTDSLVRLLLRRRASNIEHISFSSIPDMLFKF